MKSVSSLLSRSFGSAGIYCLFAHCHSILELGHFEAVQLHLADRYGSLHVACSPLSLSSILLGGKIAFYLSEIAPNAYTWKLAIGWNVFHIVLYLFVSGLE